MASKFVAPDLSNATPTSLLDEMGKLSLMESQIKKLRAVYKEAYYARVGIRQEKDGGFTYQPDWQNDPEVMPEPFPQTGVVKTGETFIATTTITWPERFDQKGFAEAHPEEFAAWKKAKAQLTTRFSLAEGVTNPVVNDLLEQMKKELDLND